MTTSDGAPESPIALSKVVHLPAGSERMSDANEEVFALYADLARAPPIAGLGSVDDTSPSVDISWTLEPPPIIDEARSRSRQRPPRPRSVDVQVTIAQDPGVLRTRKGDTASCIWRASLYFARHLLQQHHFSTSSSPPLLDLGNARILELGAGTGVLASLVGRHAAGYVATDQYEALSLIRKNAPARVVVDERDWLRPGRPGPLDAPFDVILAIDCVYNEALVRPLVRTMTAYASALTVAIVVMELRSSEVTEAFLEAWLESDQWHIWRVERSGLPAELGSGRYVIWAGQRVG